MLLLYIIIIFTLLPYISYEDPVQLPTATTSTSVVADPYHISHNEVCTVITIRLYIIIVYTIDRYICQCFHRLLCKQWTHYIQ